MVGTSGVYGERGIDHRILDLWFNTIEYEDTRVTMPGWYLDRSCQRVVFMLSFRKSKTPLDTFATYPSNLAIVLLYNSIPVPVTLLRLKEPFNCRRHS